MQAANTIIDPLQELTKAIALTGSVYNLSRLSGINRTTLTNIFKQKYTTNISTILRLKNFVEQNMHREKRLSKKQTRQRWKGLSL